MSFDFLTDEISGVYLGKFPQTPLHLLPTPYPQLPRQMSVTLGAKRLRGRLLSPDSSPPVRCPRQRCALLPKQKHSGARRMVQAEGFGWQRCAASADWGGAAAVGVLQEGWRQETGAKGGASRLPLTFCLLRFRGLYLGKFPQTPLANQMLATSGAKLLRVASCLLTLHLL